MSPGIGAIPPWSYAKFSFPSTEFGNSTLHVRARFQRVGSSSPETRSLGTAHGRQRWSHKKDVCITSGARQRRPFKIRDKHSCACDCTLEHKYKKIKQSKNHTTKTPSTTTWKPIHSSICLFRKPMHSFTHLFNKHLWTILY